MARHESLEDKYKVISCQPITVMNKIDENDESCLDKSTTLVEIENCADDQNLESNQVSCGIYNRLMIN